MQADGKLLIGSSFTHVGGQPRRYMARLHHDGTVDISAITPELAFGGVLPGASATLSAIVRHTGASGDALVVSAMTAPDHPAFTAVGGTCGPVPFQVQPGQSCTLDYTFSPTQLGFADASIELTVNTPAVTETIALNGVDPLPPQIQVTPAALSVTVPEGATASEALTIANLGDHPLTWSIGTTPTVRGTGEPVLYTTMAEFAAVAGSVVTEDFEGGPVGPGDDETCPGPFSSTTDDDCFAPGDLIEGFYAQGSQGAGQSMLVAGDGRFELAGTTIGVASAVQYTRVYFDPPVQAAALEVGRANPANDDDRVIIRVRDTNDVLSVYSSQITLPDTTTTAFAGFVSDTPIAYVEVNVRYPGGVGAPQDNELIDKLYFSGVAPGGCGTEFPDWLSVNPVAGTVAAQESTPVTIGFDAATLAVGEYTAELCVQSNDPAQPQVQVPVTLSVAEVEPVLEVTPGAIDFGGIAVGGSAAQQIVTLTSTGNVAVAVTAIDEAAAPFTRSGGDCPAPPFSLAPDESCTIAYGFEPTAAGSFDQTIDIASSGGPASIDLAGEGLLLPEIAVDPGSLSVTLDQGEVLTEPLTISNTGTAPLEWTLGTNATAGLRGGVTEYSDLASFQQMAAQAGGPIVSEDFTGGATGPGEDHGCPPLNASTDAPGCFSPGDLIEGFTVRTSNSTSPTSMVVAGAGSSVAPDVPVLTVGANASSPPIIAEFDPPVVAMAVNVYIRDLSAQDIELILRDVDGGEIHTTTVAAPAGEPTFIGVVSDQPIASVSINSLASLASAMELLETLYFSAPCGDNFPSWLSADPTSGNVAPGGSVDAAVTLDAGELSPGNYNAAVCVQSNDPERPEVRVPVSLTVAEAPMQSHLTVDPSQLDFGDVEIGSNAGPATVTLTSTGTGPATVNSIAAASAPFVRTGGSCEATPFVLAPSETCTLDYGFAPTAAGSFSGTIAIVSDADPASFDLAGTGIESPLLPPAIQVDPDLLALELETGDSVTETVLIGNLGEEDLEWSVRTDDALVANGWRRAITGSVSPEAAPFDAEAAGLRSLSRASGSPILQVPADPGLAGEAVTLTHSTVTDQITAPNTIACTVQDQPFTRGNQFLRTFALPDFGIAGSFAVQSVGFAVEALDVATDVTVNLYTLDGPFLYANLTLLATTTVELAPQTTQFVTAPIAAGVPAGATLVMELVAPDLDAVGQFYAGSNNLGETAPSYIASTACGLDEPATYASINFPQVNLLMSVTGTATDCGLLDWLSFDPLSGTVAGGAVGETQATVDATGLPGGTYDAFLCIESNDPMTPLVTLPVSLEVTDSDTVFRNGFEVTGGR